MKWIKASERLPVEFDMVHWRDSESKIPMATRSVYRQATSEDHSDEVEWLDESAPPQDGLDLKSLGERFDAAISDDSVNEYLQINPLPPAAPPDEGQEELWNELLGKFSMGYLLKSDIKRMIETYHLTKKK